MRALPLHLMPRPPSLPLVGSLPLYMTSFSKYSMETLHLNGLSKYAQYGPIVHEQLGPSSIVWLFDPSDIAQMFREESSRPKRRSHLALQHYRVRHHKLYNDGGLLPSNGDDWARVRGQAQLLFTMQRVEEFRNQIEELTLDFVTLSSHILAHNQRRSHNDLDWTEHLKRFFLELIVLYVFNIRLGALKNVEMSRETQSLLRATEMVNNNILVTDNSLPVWKIWPNKHYNELCTGLEILENFVFNHWNHRTNVFGQLLEKKDALALIIDTILAAIDTSAYSTAFVLYHLSRSPENQTSMRSTDVKWSKQFARYVLKESLRLNPVSVGIGRISETDLILGGYEVPKDTVLVTQNQVSCQLSAFVKDQPSKFVPQRWQRDAKGQLQNDMHPFLLLPFGHGPRMCIGRRLAEQSMIALIHRLVNNFHFEWPDHRTSVSCRSKLINVPDKPIRLNVKVV